MGKWETEWESFGQWESSLVGVFVIFCLYWPQQTVGEWGTQWERAKVTIAASVSVLRLRDEDSGHFDFDQYHDIDQHFRYSHMQQSSYDGAYPHPQTGRR